MLISTPFRLSKRFNGNGITTFFTWWIDLSNGPAFIVTLVKFFSLKREKKKPQDISLGGKTQEKCVSAKHSEVLSFACHS